MRHLPAYAGPGCSVITDDGTLGVVIRVRRSGGVQVADLCVVGAARIERPVSSLRRITNYDARDALRSTEVTT